MRYVKLKVNKNTFHKDSPYLNIFCKIIAQFICKDI